MGHMVGFLELFCAGLGVITSIILVGPFHLRVFHDSVNLWTVISPSSCCCILPVVTLLCSQPPGQTGSTVPGNFSWQNTWKYFWIHLSAEGRAMASLDAAGTQGAQT